MDQQNQTEQSVSQALTMLRRHIQEGTLRHVVQDWKWILSFAKGYWGKIILYTLLGVLGSALSLGSAVVSKYLIDCIVAVDRSRLLPLAAMMVLCAVLGILLSSVTGRLSGRLGVDMRNHVHRHVFRELLGSRWMQIRQFPTGDLLNRLSSDVATVSGCAVTWLPGVIIQGFTLLASLCVVLWYDPIMALIAFASTPALFFVSRTLLRRQRGYAMEMRKVSSSLSAFQAETFRNIDTLKSFGVEEDMTAKLGTLQGNLRKTVLAHNDFSIKTNVFLTALGIFVQYLALGYCLWQLWSGKILIGTMVLFLQQRTRLSNAFSALISLVPTALNGSVAAERLRELTGLEKEEASAPCQCAPGGCSVELAHVWASYEPGRSVLKDASLRADAGQVVALVGPSGEGKSTLIRLILGLIQPDSGNCAITDSAGSSFALGAATRHLFAYVPQGNTVLAGTIAENLRLVNPSATEEEMLQALRDACAWEFVSAMPQGIHSPIGEGGKGLSEGQAQRIAIARALVRRAPVMLLDEVTSALDMQTEQQVLTNLIRRGVTCIAATHRPSVLSLCARVYKVSDGSVTELSRDQIRDLNHVEL